MHSVIQLPGCPVLLNLLEQLLCRGVSLKVLSDWLKNGIEAALQALFEVTGMQLSCLVVRFQVTEAGVGPARQIQGSISVAIFYRTRAFSSSLRNLAQH